MGFVVTCIHENINWFLVGHVDHVCVWSRFSDEAISFTNMWQASAFMINELDRKNVTIMQLHVMVP